MKKAVWIRIVGYSILACVLLYVYRFRISDLINDFAYKDYVMEQLTEEQKLEDFECLYSNMIHSIPFLDTIKEIYGIDFKERKEYYIEQICATENNFEFYCILKAILKDIPSFHTDVCFPLYSHLLGLKCYDSNEETRYPGQKAKIEAWTEEIQEAVLEYENIPMVNVRYVDGCYIVETNSLPETYRYMDGYELLYINGESAEKYIVKQISTYSMSYDYVHEKVYRGRYTFNESIGEPVSVVWKDLQGNQVEQNWYVDCGIEVVATYGWLFSDKIKNYNVAEADVIMQRDDENQLEYIKINNFSNSKGEELKKYLKNTPYNTIVIDLRNNSGGVISYAQDYVYPMLYDKNASFSYQWKVPDTFENKAMTQDFIAVLNFFPKNKDNFYNYDNVVKYKGSADENKKVYYLMGKGSGSATDNYLQMVKQNDLGVLVGTNSGGEGLGASYICSSLENSSLIYVYYPSIPIETEEEYTTCGGVTPDIYISQTREDFALEQKYQKEGVALEYGKRLEYDTVLKWVINNEFDLSVIEKNGN